MFLLQYPRKKRLARSHAAGITLLLALTLIVSGCTDKQIDAGPIEQLNTVNTDIAAKIDEATVNAMKISGATQAVVGVWGAGGDYLKSFGEGATPGSHFRAAQTSQPLYCALILEKAASGQLDLDRKIRLDNPREAGVNNVTYRQLCDMRSGLADFKTGYENIFVSNPGRVWSDRELLSQGVVRSPLSWPGLDVHPADTNALVLARVLRIKYRGNDGKLLQPVLDLAGMTNTSIAKPDETGMPGGSLTPLVYPTTGGETNCTVDAVTVEKVSPTMLGAAGPAVTTATDLKNFYEAYVGGKLGDKTTVLQAYPYPNPERDEEGMPTSTEGDAAAAAKPLPGMLNSAATGKNGDDKNTAGKNKNKNGDTAKQKETSVIGVADENAATPQYGWGFGIEKIGPLWGRYGAITGTLTAAYTNPEKGYTIVVALNNASAGPAVSQSFALQLAAFAAEATGEKLAWSAADQAANMTEYSACKPAT